MTDRFKFGELKESEAVPLYVKLPKDVKAALEKMKGDKSWGKFLTELVKQ